MITDARLTEQLDMLIDDVIHAYSDWESAPDGSLKADNALYVLNAAHHSLAEFSVEHRKQIAVLSAELYTQHRVAMRVNEAAPRPDGDGD